MVDATADQWVDCAGGCGQSLGLAYDDPVLWLDGKRYCPKCIFTAAARTVAETAAPLAAAESALVELREENRRLEKSDTLSAVEFRDARKELERIRTERDRLRDKRTRLEVWIENGQKSPSSHVFSCANEVAEIIGAAVLDRATARSLTEPSPILNCDGCDEPHEPAVVFCEACAKARTFGTDVEILQLLRDVYALAKPTDAGFVPSVLKDIRDRLRPWFDEHTGEEPDDNEGGDGV